jgi:hypothetical protein
MTAPGTPGLFMWGFEIDGQRATIGGRVIVAELAQLEAIQQQDPSTRGWKIVKVFSTIGRPMIAASEWQRSLGREWHAESKTWVDPATLAQFAGGVFEPR